MERLNLYTLKEGDRVVRYGFGTEWVATAMWVDDYGFPTEDEAVVDWYFKVFKKRTDGSYYVPSIQDHDVETWMAMHSKNETQAILEWYHNIFKKGFCHATNSQAGDNSDDGQSGDQTMSEESTEEENIG